jgi:beta-xylosidase
MSFRNPILSGFNPDPSIVFVDGVYYLATSTFQYFPGVPIYRSTDLVDWKLIGHALNRPSQLQMRTTEGGGGIFAPTLRHHKGRFYMTTCCAHRIRFGTTDVSRLVTALNARRWLIVLSLSHQPFVTPRGFYVWVSMLARIGTLAAIVI